MPTATVATTPEQIKIEATRASIADIASYLQQHLGQRLTAYLSGLKDAKTVGQWAAEKVTPRDAAAMRLRHAYQAVRVISGAFGDETAKAWMFGINSQLDDEAPAFVLRHGELPETVTPVVRAATGFAESGYRAALEEPVGAAHHAEGTPSILERNDAANLAERILNLERSLASLEEEIEKLIHEVRKPAKVHRSGRVR